MEDDYDGYKTIAKWRNGHDLLLEAITLLEQSRDRLLYRAEARLKDKTIDEFLERARKHLN